MNLIEKWKSRETKKKLREENVRLKAEIDNLRNMPAPNVCTVERNVQMVKAKAIIPVMDKFSEEEIKRGAIQHLLEDELIPFIEYNVTPFEGGGGMCTAKLYVATGDRK